jgi:DNA polymerase sigma
MKTVSMALEKMKETQKQAQAQNKIINLSTFSSPTSNQFEISLTCSVSSVLTNLKLHFSNSLPFHECSLFNFYCQLDPRVRPMTFLLGYWANSGQIFTSKSQSYPSQFIVMLVLSFLIQSKILPSVQKLQEILSESSSSTEKNKLIGASNVSFCSNLSQVQKIHPPSPLLDLFKDDSILSMSILGLCKDWFKFFATADLTENAIVTRFGLLVPKKDFQPGAIGNLPGDLGRVYRFGTPGGSPKKADMKKFMFSTTPLCIQHPFDLSLNMSRDVGQGQVQKFQESCQNSGSILADLFTHDQPDLTLFLSSLGQNEEQEIDNANNVIKKVN